MGERAIAVCLDAPEHTTREQAVGRLHPDSRCDIYTAQWGGSRGAVSRYFLADDLLGAFDDCQWEFRRRSTIAGVLTSLDYLRNSVVFVLSPSGSCVFQSLWCGLPTVENDAYPHRGALATVDASGEFLRRRRSFRRSKDAIQDRIEEDTLTIARGRRELVDEFSSAIRWYSPQLLLATSGV